MSLQNLLEIGSLDEARPDRADIQRLLAAAERNLDDAGVTAISNENRFDAAYKCVMQCAIAGLLANGYRTSTSKPGHHQTAIQSLPVSIGLDKSTVVQLDDLRELRNCDDYEGVPVSAAALEDAQKQAGALLDHFRSWLREHHPELA
ncbi:DNA-binding protein [Massilia aerilata]|uniref:DNA-binding protein n=1 Tax=Massilia aerilata TaxID=453817 RepID=A0ABW0RUY0_9BURK